MLYSTNGYGVFVREFCNQLIFSPFKVSLYLYSTNTFNLKNTHERYHLSQLQKGF